MKDIRRFDLAMGAVVLLVYGTIGFFAFRGAFDKSRDAASFAQLLSILMVAGAIGVASGARGGFRLHAWFGFLVTLLFAGGLVKAGSLSLTLLLVGFVLVTLSSAVYARERVLMMKRAQAEYMIESKRDTPLDIFPRRMGNAVMGLCGVGALLLLCQAPQVSTALARAEAVTVNTLGSIPLPVSNFEKPQEVADEIQAMVIDANHGASAEEQGHYPAKTQSGQRVRDLMARLTKLQQNYDESIVDLNVENGLTVEEVRNSGTRGTYLRNLDKASQLTRDYYTHIAAGMKEFVELERSANIPVADSVLSLRQREDEELEKRTLDTYDAYREAIMVLTNHDATIRDRVIDVDHETFEHFKQLVVAADTKRQEYIDYANQVAERRRAYIKKTLGSLGSESLEYR